MKELAEAEAVGVTPLDELTPPAEELTPPKDELTPAPEELTPAPDELTPAPDELAATPEEVWELTPKTMARTATRHKRMRAFIFFF